MAAPTGISGGYGTATLAAKAKIKNGLEEAPAKERVSKDIGYVATGTVATQVLSISKTAA